MFKETTEVRHVRKSTFRGALVALGVLCSFVLGVVANAAYLHDRHPLFESLLSNELTYNSPNQIINGRASWYGYPFHGRKTANGETYNMFEMTAAHKSLPFGSLLRVTNLQNKKVVFVRVNDRGPYVAGRDLDLSYWAAHELDMANTGVSQVKIEVYYPNKSKLIAYYKK